MNIKQQIDQIISTIKQQPMNLDARLALIQYYCIDGQWDKALKTIEQYLKVNIKDDQSKTLFLNNIRCELERISVLEGYTQPLNYPHCDQYIFQLQNNLFQDWKNQVAPEVLQDQFIKSIDALTFKFKVSLSTQYVSSDVWLDSDFRYAHVLEIFVQEKYYWLPLYDIAKIDFKDNQYLTDVLWRRAEISLKDHRTIACFIPARYVFSSQEEWSDVLKLGQETQWYEYGQLSLSRGQKTLTNGVDDLAFLDIVTFHQDEHS